MDSQNDKELLKQNARLRQEIAAYQSEFEKMEVAYRNSEKNNKLLRRRIEKISEAVKEIS